MIEMELGVGEGFFVDPAFLKEKGFVGKIMWDIAFCNPSACGSQEAYLELLETTAKDVIQKVCQYPERIDNEHR